MGIILWEQWLNHTTKAKIIQNSNKSHCAKGKEKKKKEDSKNNTHFVNLIGKKSYTFWHGKNEYLLEYQEQAYQINLMKISHTFQEG